MNKVGQFMQTVAGLLVVGVLTAALGLVFQAVSPNQPAQGYPAPQETLPAEEAVPPEVPTPILVLPGETPAIPTDTPWPTFTPHPTPTRRPGPTATAMPLPKPAQDASGIIRYSTFAETEHDISRLHFALAVDASGRAAQAAEVVPLPANLGFSPIQVVPSPDGNYVAAMKLVEPLSQAYVINQSTKRVRELQEVGQFLGWHPDSQHFLFLADGLALWLVDAETFETTTLALPPQVYMQGAAISPDGQAVAYIADNLPQAHGGWPGYAIWLASTAGGDAKPQFDSGPQSYLYQTAWSPDGTRIVYYGTCADLSTEGGLCLWDRGTGERRSLNLPFVGFSPNWSPDGRYLAATGLTRGESRCSDKALPESERESCLFARSSIYIADTLTGEVRQLETGIVPVWSPDGTMLAFLSNASGAPELWTIRANGTELQQLTGDGQPKSPYDLAWSPEARR